MFRRITPPTNTQAFFMLCIPMVVFMALVIHIVEDVRGAMTPAEAFEPAMDLQFDTPPVPERIQGPTDPSTLRRTARARAEIDCILVIYHDNYWREGQRMCSKLLSISPAVRAVAYPDTYMPAILAKRRYQDAKLTLGDELLPLTPGLEWKRYGRAESLEAGLYAAALNQFSLAALGGQGSPDRPASP